MSLCDQPIIIEEGNKSFWLDKCTGKKCYMLAAKQLSIALVDSPSCWRWTSIPESRYMLLLLFLLFITLNKNEFYSSKLLPIVSSYCLITGCVRFDSVRFLAKTEIEMSVFQFF
ncbi:putative phloem protein [Helianthus anomalus]